MGNQALFRDAMFDLETLGTESDAVILSIGGVLFDTEHDETLGFYTPVSLHSSLASGRHVSADTLAWWMKQDAAAKAVFADATREDAPSLLSALSSVAAWLLPHGTVKVWSNGASFDTPMLEHAFRTVGIECPWKFWNSRCMRTLADTPAARDIERPKPKVAHNALSDALAQAQYVRAILRKQGDF